MSAKTNRRTPYRILAVDDSQDTLEVIQRNLEAKGYAVVTALSADAALEHLKSHPVDLLITDYKMPQVSGLDLLKHVSENFKTVEVMMITGYPCVDGAVQAIKEGAEEYLVKPFTDEELFEAVERIVAKKRHRQAVEHTQPPTALQGIIGSSPAMKKAFKLVQKAAQTSATVLISGESGTGKELVARAVHYMSERRAATFVPVNCAAIPDTLQESELFGHVKGAFTGAKENRPGFFQIADGGTIFLDEVGDASLSLQGKLLRVMQNQEISMVGSSLPRHVDVRIVAATHKDLPAMIKQGKFREDLYYRLNVIDIEIPPLSRRGEDVLYLVNYFTEKYSAEMNRTAPQYSDAAIRILKAYNWPGNVRELENLIQRLMVIVDGDLIDTADLPEHMRFSLNLTTGLHRTLAQVEAEHIAKVLHSVNGNKTKAAKILNIDRKTLRMKLDRA